MLYEPEEDEELPLQGPSSSIEKGNQIHTSARELQDDTAEKSDSDSTAGHRLDFSPRQLLSPTKKITTSTTATILDW